MVARIVRPSLRQKLYFLVPRAPMGEAQAAWQEAHPVNLKTDAVTTTAVYLNRSTGLGGGNNANWFCLDFGVNSEAVLLYLEGEGAFTAHYLLPYFSYLIAKNAESVMEDKGFTEEEFWRATYTSSDGVSMDMETHMKENLKRVMANLILSASGNKMPTTEEVAAIRDAFQESPDFQALSPRALYEFAASRYYQALYSADEWAERKGG